MSSFWRIFLYGIQGFRRNIWLSIIAIITMTLTLTTITVFVISDMVAAKQYEEFNRKIDYVAFLRDTAADADAQAFYSQVKKRPEVEMSAYYSKEDVRKKFEQEFGGNDTLKGIVTTDNNPLPREIDVKFHDPREIDTFNRFVADKKYEQIVESTSYQTNKGAIDNYVRMTNVLKLFGICFTVFFVLIAILVIFNTIRLAIFARREEIEIMRLVGATRGYIRGPFLIEGLFFGLIGSLVSAVLFWAILHQLQVVLQQSTLYGQANFLTDLLTSSLGGIRETHGFNALFTQILLLQTVIGVALGVLCSFIAARRYLRD